MGIHGTYDPKMLLDFLRKTLSIETDAKLAAKFGVGAALISKIRHGTHDISSEFLIKIHDVTGVTIIGLREIMGDRRRKHRYRKNKNSNFPLVGRSEKRAPVDRAYQPSDNLPKIDT